MNYSRFISMTVGVTMVAFGVHQITRPHKWYRYVPAWLEIRSPLPLDWMLRLHGGGNVSTGVFLLSGLNQKGALQLAALWWAWVTPFCGRSDWRTGLRDATIAVMLAVTARNVR